ncbi:uncharacterized protein G2W53_042673 [Senna tora]|uniref:Uncharacterized protein n=1 Tax=Senna tora TaxID=362788 RepID=A0A834SHD9_9FABA|nr:uncharacterized protein G2W53_042673 [Senna tora]
MLLTTEEQKRRGPLSPKVNNHGPTNLTKHVFVHHYDVVLFFLYMFYSMLAILHPLKKANRNGKPGRETTFFIPN